MYFVDKATGTLCLKRLRQVKIRAKRAPTIYCP